MDKYFLLPKTFIVFVILFFAYDNITASSIFLTQNTDRNIVYGEIKTIPIVSDLINSEVEIPSKSQISFVGDVMLARHVEYLMMQNGTEYPYKLMNFFDKEKTFYVGNFEGSIPVKHTKTPNYNFNFSVDKTYLGGLKNAGFTHFSLANNHSYDFNKEGFDNSKLALNFEDLTPFGNPSSLSSTSVEFIELQGIKVAIIAVNTIGTTVTSDQINEVMEYANMNSNMQIIYVHWGNEYELNQSEQQRKLATKFVRAGADLIIGHHPHVTQGVEKIDNTLVFYSLGNFIFDQYFSSAVQQGLMVTISVTDNMELTISGITSKYGLAQPKIMSNNEQNIFMTALADRSSKKLRGEILSQKFTLDIPLATSSETAIMTE